MRKSIIASTVLVVVAGLLSTASAQSGRPTVTVTPAHARLSQLSPSVQSVVRELDGSASLSMLLASLSAARTGRNLLRWALELQSVVHDRNGNYLFKLYLVLRNNDAKAAREFANLLAQEGVAIGPSTGHFERLEYLDPSAPLPSRPVNERAANASMGQWVDAFTRVDYDPSYKPNRRGSLSECLQLTYTDGSKLDIDIRLISDNYDPAPSHALAYAYVGAGGRIFPLRLGRSTTPKLWRAKHEIALAVMYRSNQEYETLVGISVAGVMSTLPLGLVAPVQAPQLPPLGAQRARMVGAPRTTPAPTSYGPRATTARGGATSAAQAERLRLSLAADEILNSARAGSGLKVDPMHRAASFVSRKQLEAGMLFNIRGGDGVQRHLLQITGEVNGRSGIFEFIIDPSRGVTHQRFIPGGRITGTPNQRVP